MTIMMNHCTGGFQANPWPILRMANLRGGCRRGKLQSTKKQVPMGPWGQNYEPEMHGYIIYEKLTKVCGPLNFTY